MFNKEFEERYAGKFYGKYKGVVERIDDTGGKKGRIQIKVPSVLGPETTGWALPAPPSGGGVNTGEIIFPEKGDFVWVEFEGGDPALPIWSAGPWGTRNGTPMLMEHSRGMPDDLDFAARDVGNIPPSQFAASYADVRMLRSSSGSFLEFDNTLDVERVQLAHFSGSRIEMTSDGSLQEISTGNIRRRSEGNCYIEIGGGEYAYFGGERSSTVMGDVEDTFNANYHRAVKNCTEEGSSYIGTWGNYSVLSNAFSLEGNSRGTISVGSQLSFMIGADLQMLVLECANISASNATNINPRFPAINLQGYNGDVVLKASDATGIISSAEIILAGNLPLANILLGGDLATEPYVLGNMYLSLFTQILTLLSTHTHPTPVGLSGPSSEIVAQLSSLLTSLTNTLSTTIMGKA